MTATIETQEELEAKRTALGDIDDETWRGIACNLIGHSRYITAFFGYQYCGRCGSQIGDSLGGVGAREVVSAEHLAWGDCPECEAVRPLLSWKDTYMLTEEAAKVEHSTREAAKVAYILEENQR